MKKPPLVTIGISSYNAESYLALAINSVINQSFEDWELIIIDDGSTDASLNIAKSYEQLDKRIRVISDGQNKKLPTRLNEIIEEGKGEYIARMDADDLIHPERLQIQLNFLKEHSGFDIVSTGTVSINDKNRVYGYRHVEEVFIDFNEVRRSHPILHASILAKKSWYLRNRYNINYPRAQDFELWCRAISNNDLNLAVLPDLLYYYREGGNLDIQKLLRSYDDGFKIYTKYQENFNLAEFSKYKFKRFSVIVANKFGLLNRIAARRNKKENIADIIDEHQKVVDYIINNTQSV